MHYTRPAHMTQTLLDGANRQPIVPTSEADGDADTAPTPAQQQRALPLPGVSTVAASCSIVEEPSDDSNRVGVIADSVPASISAVISGTAMGPTSMTSLSRRSLGLSSRHLSAPGPGPFDGEGDEAQRLAQRALRTLQSHKPSMKERGSWPGGEAAWQWM